MIVAFDARDELPHLAVFAQRVWPHRFGDSVELPGR